ncbi:MAG: hypothetical protein PHR43_04825 [Dehalococcoidales bacterium]|nr:hypothetical protein [Dehalococcoidales bacterium]
MPAKTRTKTIDFEEKDESFIKKLADDIGCYYSKPNTRTYNLNKFGSSVNREMGVFGWVHKEEADCFWISTRKSWVTVAKARSLTGKKASEISSFPRDCQLDGDSVSFDITDNYQKIVTIMKLINETRSFKLQT